MTIKEYRNHEGYNYSKLVKADLNIKSVLRDTEPKESLAMDKGSALDMLLTNKEAFESSVIKGPEQYTKNTTKILMNLVLETKPTHSKNVLLKRCLDIIKEHNLWASTKKQELLIKNFWNEDFVLEYKLKTQYKDKIILSVSDYNEVVALAEAMKNHSMTSKYIHGENKDYIYQKAIIFDYRGKTYKSLLDVLIIDHWKKTIQPVDIKTSDDHSSAFAKKVFNPMFRYDIQASLYTKAVLDYRNNYYPDYTVEDFRFVVGSFKYPEQPLVYNAKEILDIGEHGGVSKTGYQINGFLTIVDNIEWHIKNDLWDYNKDVYENNEVIIKSSFLVDEED